MYVYYGDRLLKIYNISLGVVPIGAKQSEGDEKTPEGDFVMNVKNLKSEYHKNLGISYPNVRNLLHAKKQGKNAGGGIKIHGLPNGLGFLVKSHRFFNWTDGCIAVTDQEIQELYYSTIIGTSIQIQK